MRRCVAFFVSIAVDAMFRYEPGPQQPVAHLLTPRILHCGSLHCRNVRKDDRALHALKTRVPANFVASVKV